ncbi:MAG: type II secretion system F family protein [Oscillospiraceae bacterium]|jgi:tight adherence protein C|nr:type II secretion system F family protein [Oscillospiraceae bacterium]
MGAIGDAGILALLTLGTLLSACFVLFYLRGRGLAYMVEPLGAGHPMKEIYLVGLASLVFIRYKYNSRFDRKMLGYCRIIHGAKFADYYYRIVLAEMISLASAALIVTFFLSAMANELLILLFGLAAAAGLVYYVSTTVTDKIHERQESIFSDFSTVLSKLALLVNAGMILGEAWEKVSGTGEGVLYDEMRAAVEEARNGRPEIEAYQNFASRCGVPEVNKFASTLVQNLHKGNRELVAFLRQASNESWSEKKHRARRKGEEASGKLLIPIGLMFIGLLIMIMVPILANITF